MIRPEWSRTDDETADLLTLVRDEGHVSADREWGEYLSALDLTADEHDVISPNRLRRLIRGVVAPRRIGAFTNRALKQGLITYTGDWEISDDTEGRNAGKPCRVMRLAAQSARAAS